METFLFPRLRSRPKFFAEFSIISECPASNFSVTFINEYEHCSFLRTAVDDRLKWLIILVFNFLREISLFNLKLIWGLFEIDLKINIKEN